MSEVIKVECPCGATFSYDHGDTTTGEKLATEFITRHYEHKSIAKVTHLNCSRGDLLLIEYIRGSIEPNKLVEIGEALRDKGFTRWEFVGLNPGRGELKFTVINKESVNPARQVEVTAKEDKP